MPSSSVGQKTNGMHGTSDQSTRCHQGLTLSTFLGKSLMDSGELERAEKETRAGLALTDESELGWYVLADILNRRGRRAEADRAVAQARALAEARDNTSPD